MRRHGAACAILLAVAVLSLGVAEVRAQQAKPESVRGRARPEFAAIGMELGTMLSPLFFGHEFQALQGFTAFPRFEAEFETDDNLFNQSNEGVSDNLYRLKPSLNIASEWANHSLSVEMSGDIGRYFENKDENFEDGKGRVAGGLDILEEGRLNAAYSFLRGHEIGGAPTKVVTDATGPFGAEVAENFEDATGSTIYNREVYELGLIGSNDPLIARIESIARYTDYIDTGTTDNDGRDRWEWVTVPRLGYQFWEDTSLFVQPRYTTRIYDSKIDTVGNEKDSSDYELLLGGTYDYSGVTYLDFGVGVIHSDFDERDFRSITGIGYNVTALWNVTGLTTFTLRALRSNAGSTDSQTKLVQTDNFSLTWDWEALDNLLVGATAGLSLAHFLPDKTEFDSVGVAIDNRFDTTQTYQFVVDYFPNEYAFAGLSYSHTVRRSNREANELSKNVFKVRAGIQL
ncbi:MAG: outer membrane beta-barrel protein [Rhodospirillaceae bacterium]|nr:outer membrane beta-barrel protein [Rhodospirillaceae bacterium]